MSNTTHVHVCTSLAAANEQAAIMQAQGYSVRITGPSADVVIVVDGKVIDGGAGPSQYVVVCHQPPATSTPA